MLGDNVTENTEGFGDTGESFLDLGENLNDVPDLELIPDKTETRVRLVKAEVKQSENTGNRYIGTYLIADEFPNSPGINSIIMLPSENDDMKQKMDKLRKLKDFATAFGIVQVGTKLLLDQAVADQPTCYAIIGIEVDKNGEYPDKNKVKRFVLPRK